MDLGDLVKTISSSRRDVFPVVDHQHRLVGILYLDNVRPIMFRQELYHRFKIAELMSEPVARLSINDSMDVVLITFDKTNAWTLPVVDGEGIFMGFVRKSHVLTNYRKTLADFSDE
jgi:CIC family chloride channel protein